MRLNHSPLGGRLQGDSRLAHAQSAFFKKGDDMNDTRKSDTVTTGYFGILRRPEKCIEEEFGDAQDALREHEMIEKEAMENKE